MRIRTYFGIFIDTFQALYNLCAPTVLKAFRFEQIGQDWLRSYSKLQWGFFFCFISHSGLGTRGQLYPVLLYCNVHFNLNLKIRAGGSSHDPGLVSA